MKVEAKFIYFLKNAFTFIYCVHICYMYVCIHVAWCMCRGWEQTSAGGSPLQLGGFWGSASGPQGFQWVPSGLAVCSLTTWDILLAPSLDFKKLTTPNTKTLGLSSLASLKTEPIPSGGFFPIGDLTSSKQKRTEHFAHGPSCLDMAKTLLGAGRSPFQLTCDWWELASWSHVGGRVSNTCK